MYPSDLKYTKEHEWVKINGAEARVGITDYARSSSATWCIWSCPKSAGC